MVNETRRIIGTFEDELGGAVALEALKSEPKTDPFTIDNTILLCRSADGSLKQVDARRIKKRAAGAIVGGISGAALGLYAGSVGRFAGLGAIAGSVATKIHDSAFRDEQIQRLSECLAPGTSALVVVAHGSGCDAIERTLESAGATLVVETIDAIEVTEQPLPSEDETSPEDSAEDNHPGLPGNESGSGSDNDETLPIVVTGDRTENEVAVAN